MYMKFKKYLLAVAVSGALGSANATDHAVQVDASKFTATGSAPTISKSTGLYIVKMKGSSAISKAVSTGELVPDTSLTNKMGNQYNPASKTVIRHVNSIKDRQASVASTVGVSSLLHQYAHTFNGFSARLTPSQVASLRSHPDVAAVYEDELHQVQTMNTPEFLGLTGEGGQHTLGIKGEDVIVGILDTGIWPEHPSFSEDPEVDELAYGPAPERWTGTCNTGSVGEFIDGEGNIVYNDETVTPDEFTCNNKLIGASYFGSTFSSVYEIQFGLGEFASPRDADSHGSHTASTAAGNEGVTATLEGVDIGTVSGIAPRARVAAYKVCWNSSFVSEAGVAERGCFFGDSMAAIEQAVLDGVDVLNYSIGNSTAINSPVYNAALEAADAGVFFAASAGNSGPTAATTSNIAPWITTVGASTYDGETVTIGNALEIDTGDLAGEEIFSVHASIGPEVPAEGFTGELALADDIEACESLSSDLTGKFALIARGTCAFTTKMFNAEAAGAVGVVVYTDDRDPIAMGRGAGDETEVNIPGVMVTNADGLALVDSVNNGSTQVTMGFEGAATTNTQVGNIMASFSSRGENPQTSDIIKPDITAPGVNIFAAISPDQLDIDGNSDGETFGYLSGTSMSGPHIAGMGALLMGQYPDWSPAEVKSALMTTAYQGVFKEDGATPADPFDFGAGHASPVDAMNPGLVYSADLEDYLGFLCGQGEEQLVSDTTDGEITCSDLDPSSFEASQLNYPSIAVTDLSEPTTISRTVTDVTGFGGTYMVEVDAPVGIEVDVDTPEGDGMIVVPANGEATYSLTFTPGEGFTPNEFGFGSVTLSSGEYEVRSPIAVSAVSAVKIDVPEFWSLELTRGRGSFFYQTLYTGDTSISYQGLTPASGYLGQSVDYGAFDFVTGLDTAWFLEVPEDTSVFRFVLADGLVETDLEVDIDLLVYRCEGYSCTFVTSSENLASNEEILLTNPEPAGDSSVGDLYLVFPYAYDLLGLGVVDYTMLGWIVDEAESTTRIVGSTRAIAGRYNNVRVTTRGLNENIIYMGSVTYYDDEGVEQGTTVLEVQP